MPPGRDKPLCAWKSSNANPKNSDRPRIRAKFTSSGSSGTAGPDCCDTRFRSAAVEHVVAEIFHFEDRRIRPARGRFHDMRFDDFADDDMVIALGDDRLDPAFDCGGHVVQDRRTRYAGVIALAA